MMLLDRLRPPSPFDPSASAYKDWLHLNVVDARSGVVGLVNVSLHGAPTDARARAVGTALFHVPDAGWVGNLVVRGHADARVGYAGIALDDVALTIDHAAGHVDASARLAGEGLALQLRATATSQAFVVDWPLPLGSGWVSWYAVPRLRVEGSLRVEDTTIVLDDAIAYHDHNWGRWHWGDDLGWDWATFLVTGADVAVAVARTTDRRHDRVGAPVVLVDAGAHRRVFVGDTVELRFQGRAALPLRRLPGTVAALRQDRARPRLPRRVRLRASDGVDQVDIAFDSHAAVQLVTADPIHGGTSFIHELAGSFAGEIDVGGTAAAVSGLGVVEHVD